MAKRPERARKARVVEASEDAHRVTVAAWMTKAGDGLPPARLVELTERAFSAMWSRAELPLGEVALAAIADRVLCTASERFPLLSPISVDATAVRFEALREHADELDGRALAAGIQFLLVEFLTVVGHLTAEVLTPGLHARLSAVKLDGAGRRTKPRKVPLERRKPGPTGRSRA